MKDKSLLIPSLFGQLGDWKYYSTLMTLGDVVEKIGFAAQVNEMRDGKNLSDLIQRALTDGRSKDIATYLLENEDRFFNALVVAVYGGEPQWLEFAINPTGRNSQFAKAPNWALNTFGFLSLSGNEELFALDGQHRLAGIAEALKRDPSLKKERLAVIFVAHKTTDAGRRRTRKLFAKLNRSAVAVNKSEIIALDESDTAAIITRRLVEESGLFSDGKVLTAYGTPNLSATDAEHFITIIKLYDVVGYLIRKVLYSMDTRAQVKLGYVRPDDETLERYYVDVLHFLKEFISSVPELNNYFRATPVKAKRLLKNYRYSKRNILFRSVGLDVFMKLVEALQPAKGQWAEVLPLLSLLPREFPLVPYKGVIYDLEGERIIRGRIRLTCDLLRYMLGDQHVNVARLRAKYGESIGRDPERLRLPPRIKR